jgi:hypothetical protein
VIYVGALVTGTVYTSAKALAIASPLVLLIALGGLAEGLGRRVALGALAGLLGIAALASSFLVLRQAPVAPSTHASELASFRHVIGDRKVLFLGRDNFIQFELHPARPFVAVRNYYDNDYVRPNLKLGPEVFKKFDFDSVKPEDLVRFPFVITTRGRYASGPPPWLQPAGETPSFLLWKRVTKGPTLDRHVLDEGDAPGAILNCRDRSSLPAAGIASYFPKLPVTGADWSGGPTVESGSSVSQALRLTRGTWDVSLQYDATQPVHLSGPGLDVTIPANLDYRGTTPYYAAGELLVKKAGDATITVSVERPPFMGRLLGASSIAHLGGIALTLAKPDSGLPLRGACGKYVDWYAEN